MIEKIDQIITMDKSNSLLNKVGFVVYFNYVINKKDIRMLNTDKEKKMWLVKI